MASIAKALGDGVSIAGELSLKRIFIHDAKRLKKYNIYAAFLEMDIYEDIFSSCLSGTITIVEATNLIFEIPLLGDEMLEIEYSTPSLESTDTIKKTFSITKVDQREHGGDKKNVYVLHFISKEGLIDLNSKISRSYEGNPHEIVKKIFNTELKVNDEVEVDDSDGKIKFISPYWSPFKCINYATSRCMTPNTKSIAPNFLFYQTMKKFKLKSLSNLFSQQSFTTYFFDKNPARAQGVNLTSVPDIDRQYSSIKELYFINSQDYIDNISNGSLSHKVYGVDLLRKNFSTKTYRIDRDFAKSSHLDKFPIISPEAVISDHGLFQMRTTSPQLFDGIADKADDLLVKRISLLGQLDLFKLDIVVPGRTDIEVGMVVDFELNQFRETDDEEKLEKKIDPYYSGRYLITAIQHRLTQTRHLMTMQIVKESTPNEFKIGIDLK